MNINDMNAGRVYTCLVVKAEKKGRTRSEVDQVTEWLTGYTSDDLSDEKLGEMTYGEFISNAPALNPNRELIKGKICGVQIETIEDDFMKTVRQLDKLVDELAKGKAMEKILRTSK